MAKQIVMDQIKKRNLKGAKLKKSECVRDQNEVLVYINSCKISVSQELCRILS